MAGKSERILFFTAIFTSGGAILVVEILGTRLLAPYFGSTIFVWSSLLITSLGGLALGYFVGGKLSKKTSAHTRYFYAITIISGVYFMFLPTIATPILGGVENLGLKLGPLVGSLALFLLLFIADGILGPLGVHVISRTEESGSAAGKIYGVSTVGSLAAALLVGFFLIPIAPLSILFKATGSLLIALGIIGMTKVYRTHTAGAIVVIFLAFLSGWLTRWPIDLSGSPITVIARASTFYTGLKVVEFSNYRCIVGGLKLYSCVDRVTGKASDDFSVIRYAINPFLERIPNGGSALLLGGGSGMALENMPGDTHGTIVEIDPKVIDFGEKYLSLDGSKYDIIIDDARHAIKNFSTQHASFNLIIMDVIADTKIPQHIISQEAFEEFSSILAADGTLIIHGGISTEQPAPDDAYIAAVLATAKTVFPYSKVVWHNDLNSRNIIFYFSRQAISNIIPIPELTVSDNGNILTDDFDPLDYYNLDRQLKLTEELRSFLGLVALL